MIAPRERAGKAKGLPGMNGSPFRVLADCGGRLFD